MAREDGTMNPQERSVSPEEALARTGPLRAQVEPPKPVPVTYAREIARLERRVAHLEGENATLRKRAKEVRGVRLVGRLRTDPRYRVRCEECGAEPFHLCRAPSESRLRLPHHMRGRTEPCARPMGCKVCIEAFGVKAIEMSREAREASDDS